MSNVIACAICTEDDFAGDVLAAEGKASWEIIKALNTTSKAGNNMVKVTFKVIDSTGHSAFVFENVPMHVQWRVAKIASATGTSEMAKTGNIDIDQWLNKKGMGIIGHEESEGYAKKAIWKKFLKEGENAPAALATPAVDPDFNDDINF